MPAALDDMMHHVSQHDPLPTLDPLFTLDSLPWVSMGLSIESFLGMSGLTQGCIEEATASLNRSKRKRVKLRIYSRSMS